MEWVLVAKIDLTRKSGEYKIQDIKDAYYEIQSQDARLLREAINLQEINIQELKQMLAIENCLYLKNGLDELWLVTPIDFS